MLTEKQYKLLMFINKVLKETGCSPSFEEMKGAVGLKSKSGIHALIASLEERNFIKRLPHKARALEVVRMPKFKPSAIIEEEKNASKLCKPQPRKFRFTEKLLPAHRLKLSPMKANKYLFRLIWSPAANFML